MQIHLTTHFENYIQERNWIQSEDLVINVSLTLTGSRQTLALPERDVCWNVRTCPEQTPLGFHWSPKPIIYLDVELCSQHLPQKLNVQRATLGSAPCVLAPTVSSAGGDEPHKSLRHPAPGPPHKTSKTSERGSAKKKSPKRRTLPVQFLTAP